MGSCNRCEGGVCTKEGKGISIVERRERESERVCKRVAEERIHPAVKITTNGASILCRKEGWKEKDGAGLPVS